MSTSRVAEYALYDGKAESSTEAAWASSTSIDAHGAAVAGVVGAAVVATLALVVFVRRGASAKVCFTSWHYIVLYSNIACLAVSRKFKIYRAI
jgi:hypothetical protein